MLSVNSMSIGSNKYYEPLAVTDYYSRPDRESQGNWCGSGARPLGLKGVVEEEALQQLIRGYRQVTGRLGEK